MDKQNSWRLSPLSVLCPPAAAQLSPRIFWRVRPRRFDAARRSSPAPRVGPSARPPSSCAVHRLRKTNSTKEMAAGGASKSKNYWEEAANLDVKPFIFLDLLLQVFIKNTLSLQAVLGGRVSFTLLKDKDAFMRIIVWPSKGLHPSSSSPSPSSLWFHWRLTLLAAAPPSWPAAGFWSWGCPFPALASSDSGLFVSAAPVDVKQQNEGC